MIYNPYFEQQGIDAVVVPMGVKAEDYPQVLASLMKLTNLRGALITMPHKVTTVSLVDEVTPTAKIAGACNAVLRRPDGSLLGDMFDGAGFVRGVQRKGMQLAGARALVVGCGGVGSRDRRVAGGRGHRERSGSSMPHAAAADGLADRLRRHYPALDVSHGLQRSGRLRAGRERDADGNERRRSVADGREPHRAIGARRRGRDEAGNDGVPARRASTRLPLPGGHRHAVRADSRVSRVLRIPDDDAGEPARRGARSATDLPLQRWSRSA